MIDFKRLPSSVVMGECWARDGLQSEPTIGSTDDKVEIIRGLVEAGSNYILSGPVSHQGIVYDKQRGIIA